MSVSYKMKPSGKECYCQVLSEGKTNKEGENLPLTSAPTSAWPLVALRELMPFYFPSLFSRFIWPVASTPA